MMGAGYMTRVWVASFTKNKVDKRKREKLVTAMAAKIYISSEWKLTMYYQNVLKKLQNGASIDFSTDHNISFNVIPK